MAEVLGIYNQNCIGHLPVRLLNRISVANDIAEYNVIGGRPTEAEYDGSSETPPPSTAEVTLPGHHHAQLTTEGIQELIHCHRGDLKQRA